jgi:hypothetical protein
MSADTPIIDLAYRKRTHVIAAIKGERRRNTIRHAFDADRVSPLDELFATPTLPDEHRLALGRLHPSLMGRLAHRLPRHPHARRRRAVSVIP